MRTILISRALRLPDLIDLLYGYENRNAASPQTPPLLPGNRTDTSPSMGVHDLNEVFFERHFGKDFADMLKNGFLKYDKNGKISDESRATKSDLMGTRTTGSRGVGEGIKKEFFTLINMLGYDESGRSRAIEGICEANRKTLESFRPEQLTALREGLIRYIDGIPAAEKDLGLDHKYALVLSDGRPAGHLKSFLEYCKAPLTCPIDSDEEGRDACARSLAWLMIGALLRTKIKDPAIARFYSPDRERLTRQPSAPAISLQNLECKNAELRICLVVEAKSGQNTIPGSRHLSVVEIDSRLCPNISEWAMGKSSGPVPEDSSCRCGENCPVREIIRGILPLAAS